ncbi:transcriptional regulator [Bacillus shivajii]|uniref:helix-turn-helix domain-containing protein n=1 Tax=Bacillus shivajii TaxID=1983719 RepID=UPI001CF9DFF2|nr:transcriptional regulator [Bacillus shivajii]UCZ53448.1 transcriptional regulator [Bacillus shivajii]
MIGNRLKTLRIQRNLTQEELSEGIISSSYISQIENDKKVIPRYIAEDLANKLNVPVDYLLGKDLEKNVSSIKQQLVNAFRFIDEKNYAAFIQQVNELKQSHKESISHPDVRTYLQVANIFIEFKKKNYQAVKTMTTDLVKDAPHFDPYPHMIINRIQGGLAYFHHEYEESIAHYKKATDIAAVNEFKDQIGRLYQFMGTCHAIIDNFYKAIQAFYSALHWFQEVADLKGQVCTYINLGNALADIQEEEEAVRHYKKAQSLIAYLNDAYLESTIEYNMAFSEFNLNNISKALSHLNRAIDIKKKLNDDCGLVRCQLLKCEINLADQDLKEMRRTLFNMLYRMDHINDPQILARYYRTFGDYFYTHGKMHEYENYYKKSIKYYEEINLSKEISKLYFSLAENTGNEQYYKYSAQHVN